MATISDTPPTSWAGGFCSAWVLATSLGAAFVTMAFALLALYQDGPASALMAFSAILIVLPFVAVVAAVPVAVGYAVLRFAVTRGASLTQWSRVKFGILFAFTLDVFLSMAGLSLHTPNGAVNSVVVFVAVAQIVSVMTAVLIPRRFLGVE